MKNILLIGETETGKSSLGNFIIGNEKFKSEKGPKRITTTIHGEISEKNRDIYITAPI